VARNILAAVFLAAAFFISDAKAHGTRQGPLPPGIPIPALTHGQMAVVARYRSAILDLADRQTVTDPTFRRLMNYSNIQATYCLWGLVPGSISDEASPFNECAHAYLAATKALLSYMNTMPGDAKAATQLIATIDAEMYARGASWQLCEFSTEPFSTGEFIRPHWADLWRDWPSALTFVGLGLLLGIGGALLFGSSRRSPPGA
jgi:hypothetical protein